LESPHAEPPRQLPLQARALADEHRRAMAVKQETPVLVCIGNPPYDRELRDPAEDDGRRRKGGWIRFGEHGEPLDRALLEDFLRPARESGQGVNIRSIYNDYVYFWRWALWKVFETKPGPGIVSFITASSYLKGPGFVGMRELMRRTFDELWIIDLGGDSRGQRSSENVFDIRTPVAIAVGIRYSQQQTEAPANTWYARLAGTRATKLQALAEVTEFSSLNWQSCAAGWHAPFTPAAKEITSHGHCLRTCFLGSSRASSSYAPGRSPKLATCLSDAGERF
jgi:predicted helicase